MNGTENDVNAQRAAQAAAAAQMRQQLMSAPDAQCGKCGHTFFENVFKVKKISALMSPNGQESIVPVQTLRCLECGNILNDISDFSTTEEDTKASPEAVPVV